MKVTPHFVLNIVNFLTVILLYVASELLFFIKYFLPSAVVATFCFYYTASPERRKKATVVEAITYCGIFFTIYVWMCISPLLYILGYVLDKFVWDNIIYWYTVLTKWLATNDGSFIVSSFILFFLVGCIIWRKRFIKRCCYWLLKIVGGNPKKENYPTTIVNAKLFGVFLISITISYLNILNIYITMPVLYILQMLNPKNNFILLILITNVFLFIFCNYFFRFIRKLLAK